MTTHPTGPAGTGPGRILAALLARTQRKVAAETAGAGGTSTAPLDAGRRLGNYERQNGTGRLTPRQVRRMAKKAARLAVRAV